MVIITTRNLFYMYSCCCVKDIKVKGKGHPWTGTEALYRPYGP